MTTNTNVDDAELLKFKSLANEWWNPKGKMRPLHHLNPVRLQYINEYAPLAAKKVVDIGCGGGILSETLCESNAIVSGIDLNDGLIQVARQHAQQKNLAIDYQTISSAEFAAKHSQQFDIVTCMELLEHVPNPSGIIADCAKLLRPGGSVFFSTINRNIKAFLGAIIGAEYLLHLLPRGTHHYEKLIRPSELITWARQAQLALKDLHGMRYNPFTHHVNLTRDVSINYLCCFEKE